MNIYKGGRSQDGVKRKKTVGINGETEDKRGCIYGGERTKQVCVCVCYYSV